MNRTSWAYLVLFVALVLQGCGEDASDAGDLITGSPDATNLYPGAPDGGNVGFPSFPDVAAEDHDGEGDSESGDADGSESSEDAVTPEEDGTEETDGTTEGGDDVVEDPDVVDPEDTEEETDASGEEGGPQGPAFVGEPCTPEFGCVKGASCIEAEDGGTETLCFEDVGEGSPCGPGFGQCTEGYQCLTQENGEKVCIQIIEEGGDCSAPGVTCPAGQLCLPSLDITGFETTGSFSGGGTGAGSLHWDESMGILWVSDSAGGAVRGLGADGTVLWNVTFPEGTLETPTPDGLFFGGDTLWIADSANHTIWSAKAPEYVAVPVVTGEDIFGIDGPKDVLWRDSGTPSDLVLASSPTLGVIQTFNTLGGQGLTLGSEEVLTTPKGLWDWGGGLWIADTAAQQITVLDGAGLVLLEYGGPTEEGGSLVAPEDIALSNSGDLIYLADSGGSQVVVYDFDGVVVDTLTGPEGWTPVAVAVSNDGSAVFVLDGASGEISIYGATYSSLCVNPGAAGILAVKRVTLLAQMVLHAHQHSKEVSRMYARENWQREPAAMWPMPFVLREPSVFEAMLHPSTKNYA